MEVLRRIALDASANESDMNYAIFISANSGERATRQSGLLKSIKSAIAKDMP